VACQFIGSVSGAGGDIHTNTIVATAEDDAGNTVSGRASFDVNIISINVGAAGYLVWRDENGDGIRDISEPGIGGVTVDLEVDDNNDGTFDRVAASTVTRQSGFYAFIPVPSGNYRIRVTDQFGVLTNSTLSGGTNPNDFALAGGQLYTQANFGYFSFAIGGGVIPPVLPPLPPPAPPEPEPQPIPTLPLWSLLLMIMTVLGIGGHLVRTSPRKRKPAV
jgi:hypothetical protein